MMIGSFVDGQRIITNLSESDIEIKLDSSTTQARINCHRKAPREQMIQRIELLGETHGN